MARDAGEASLLRATLLALLASACGMLVPTLASNDPNWHAWIARSMASSGDWVNLVHNGTDWLDKPHVVFWASALSFRLYGVRSAAFLFPALVFHAVGALFTVRLARLFTGRAAALAASLIYATSLRLLLSAYDVRMEAYLLGEIVPACYYWLVYDREGGTRPLLLGSFFTGLALMTKGPFVALTIFSGLAVLWTYQGRPGTALRPRWLLAWLASLAAIVPELACLYLQFDAHPEKVVFGRTHVSGIAWYFWGSQFGRFSNTGPIARGGGSPFFFVSTLLWAFLPWTVVFLAAIRSGLRDFRSMPPARREALVYLHGSLWPTFLLFSASRFQLDHYTNILLPFAAILCAVFLESQGILPAGPERGGETRLLAGVQRWTGFSIALIGAAIAFAFVDGWWALVGVVPLGVALAILFAGGNQTIPRQVLLAPAFANVSLLLVFLVLSFRFSSRYDAGYNIARTLDRLPRLPVYVVGSTRIANSLGFHSPNPTRLVEKVPDGLPCYAVVDAGSADSRARQGVDVIGSFQDVSRDSIAKSVLSRAHLERAGSRFSLIRVAGPGSAP